MLETTVYKKTSEGRLDWELSSEVGNMLWLETYVRCYILHLFFYSFPS